MYNIKEVTDKRKVIKRVEKDKKKEAREKEKKR